MKRNVRHNTWIVVVSIFVAVLLSIFPKPYWLEMLSPLWLLMVLVFWAMSLENTINLGVAWCIGLLQDVLQNTSFGIHGLFLVVVIYMVRRLRRQIQHYPPYQQASMMFVLSLVYQIGFYIYAQFSNAKFSAWIWLSVATTALIYPVVYWLLLRLKIRFYVR